jgi:hypothetical protein
MVSLLLRRKGLRTPGSVVNVLSRGSKGGASTLRGAAPRQETGGNLFSLEVQRLARPMLTPLTMEIRERCSRARRGEARDRPIDWHRVSRSPEGERAR